VIDWHDGRQGDRRKKLGSLRFQPFNSEVADLDLIIQDLSENGHKVMSLSQPLPPSLAPGISRTRGLVIFSAENG
jgi:hypothetical protein